MGQTVQVFGSVLILVSFGLAQLQRMRTQSVPYLTANLAGSAILAASAAAGAQWGFLLLEGAWALVSMLGLAIAARRRWRGPGVPAEGGVSRAGAPSDGTEGISCAFERSAKLDAEGLSISASPGSVTLSGAVRSRAEHDEAIAAAWAAPGVTEVHDHIKIEYVTNRGS